MRIRRVAEPAVDGPQDRLATALDAHPPVGRPDVGLHGVDAEVRLLGDLLVAEALGDQPQDLALPHRQVVELGTGSRHRGRRPASGHRPPRPARPWPPGAARWRAPPRRGACRGDRWHHGGDSPPPPAASSPSCARPRVERRTPATARTCSAAPPRRSPGRRAGRRRVRLRRRRRRARGRRTRQSDFSSIRATPSRTSSQSERTVTVKDRPALTWSGPWPDDARRDWSVSKRLQLSSC